MPGSTTKFAGPWTLLPSIASLEAPEHERQLPLGPRAKGLRALKVARPLLHEQQQPVVQVRLQLLRDGDHTKTNSRQHILDARIREARAASRKSRKPPPRRSRAHDDGDDPALAWPDDLRTDGGITQTRVPAGAPPLKKTVSEEMRSENELSSCWTRPAGRETPPNVLGAGSSSNARGRRGSVEGRDPAGRRGTVFL